MLKYVEIEFVMRICLADNQEKMFQSSQRNLSSFSMFASFMLYGL